MPGVNPADRRFFVSLKAESFLGKQVLFSLNNGWAKYYQVDHIKLD
jgi:hypothetical protein